MQNRMEIDHDDGSPCGAIDRAARWAARPMAVPDPGADARRPVLVGQLCRRPGAASGDRSGAGDVRPMADLALAVRPVRLARPGGELPCRRARMAPRGCAGSHRDCPVPPARLPGPEAHLRHQRADRPFPGSGGRTALRRRNGPKMPGAAPARRRRRLAGRGGHPHCARRSCGADGNGPQHRGPLDAGGRIGVGRLLPAAAPASRGPAANRDPGLQHCRRARLCWRRSRWSPPRASRCLCPCR